jgi:hypothetical protein
VGSITVARHQLLCSLDQQKRTAAKLRHFMVREFGIAILPDLLANDLDLVIVGTAAGSVSARRGLYYAGPGNRFWRTLHEVGLTPMELRPDEYAKLLDYGRMTDLAKGACGADSNLKPADFGSHALALGCQDEVAAPSGLQWQDRCGALFRRPDRADQLRTAIGHDRPDGHLCLLLNVVSQRALVLRAMGRVGAH